MLPGTIFGNENSSPILFDGENPVGMAVSADGEDLVLAFGRYETEFGSYSPFLMRYGLYPGEGGDVTRASMEPADLELGFDVGMIAFTPAGTLLACTTQYVIDEVDLGGGIVELRIEWQESEEVVTVLRFIPVMNPLSVAVHGDVIAVGLSRTDNDDFSGYQYIKTFSYENGDLMGVFTDIGADICCVDSISGLRFAPDGSHIIAATNLPGHLAVFTVDGAFVKTIGDDVNMATGYPFYSDVGFAPSGEVVAVGAYQNSNQQPAAYVFDLETGDLVRQWDLPGPTPDYPEKRLHAQALAFAYGQLLVLGQVFEFGNPGFFGGKVLVYH